MTSAQGEDRSDYQPVTSWAGLDFGFAKATNGLGSTDPTFAANWANLAAEGLPRGAYHELTGTASAGAQAEFFVATVQGQGLRPGDMLAVVASDYPGVTGATVRECLDEVTRLAGPHCPVLVYTDRDFLPQLTACTRYGLWLAWPSPTAPESVAPFPSWRFWQWGETSVDKDAYNGTAAELRAWIATFTDPSPAPSPSPAPEDTVIELDTTVSAHPLLIPYGTPTIDLLSVATDEAPAMVAITWLNEGSRPVGETVSWGGAANEPSIKVPPGIKKARLDVVSGGGPRLAVRFNPAPAP